MEIAPSLFRAYDIRGVVGDTLTPDSVDAIARAFAAECAARGQDHAVIGRDGRLSGPELSAALRDGLVAGGLRVTDIGAVPTPVLYFATVALETGRGGAKFGSAILIVTATEPRLSATRFVISPSIVRGFCRV